MLAELFVPAAIIVVLAGILCHQHFCASSKLLLVAIFVTAEIFVFCLYRCFTTQVNNYGHGETVSSPYHTFPGQEAVSQYFVKGAQ